MSIRLDCACGKAMKVPDEHAGKRVKCPGCGAVLTVPSAPPPDDDDPAAALAKLSAGEPVAKAPPAAPAKSTAKPPVKPAPGSKSKASADQYEALGLEAPPPADLPPSAAPTRCPGCGKQLTPGVKICITCGYDLNSGRMLTTKAGPKERPIAATTERAPWATIFGIEFTTAKLIMLALFAGGIIALIVGVLLPAKASRAEFDELVKKHEFRLVRVINLKIDEVGPENTTVVDLHFDEPMFMLSVPPVMAFSGVITDERTSLPYDVVTGTYDYKTGELKIRMPNRTDSGDGKVNVATTVPPEGDELAGQTAGPKPPAPTPKTPRTLPTIVPGMNYWELREAEDWLVVVHLAPWPPAAGAPMKLSLTIGQSATPFMGKLSYRLSKDEAGEGEWIEMKQLEGTTAAAAFEAQTMLMTGKVFVQFKVQRPGEGRAIELNDWMIEVP